MYDILACLSLCILRFVSLDASFEMLCCMHPSRCFVVCILRGAFLYASFEVLCSMHPSRCFVVCGKNVYNFVIVITRRAKCESNVKKNVSPLSRTWLVGSLVRRMR